MIQPPIKYDNEIKRWLTTDGTIFDRAHPKNINVKFLDYIAPDDGGPAIVEAVIENDINKLDTPFVGRFYIHVIVDEIQKLAQYKGTNITVKVTPSDYLSYLSLVEWKPIIGE